LPLSNKRNKIAVIGPNANDAQMLWGNYNGTPVHTITILDGIKGKVGADKVIYDKGCDLVDDKILESAIPQSSAGGKSGIKATYWNNRNYSGDVVTTEQLINPLKLSTTGQHEFASGVHLEGFSARYETVYKATKSGDLVFKLEAAGAFQLSVNGESKIRTNNWRPTPSRVSVHVEEGREYKIEIQYAQLNNWGASLNFDFGFEKPVNYNALLEKLKGVNLVIFVGGISPKLEGEEMPVQLPGFKGGDRTDIELPAVQRNCLKALKAAGKTVIYVNCSGSAIALVPETQSCDAILQAWYSGEAGGQAVADVLFGDYNPNGHLPVTFYRNLQQLPEFTDYSMKGRTYRYMSTDPLFPFGFGLSYTTFRIGEGKLDKTTLGLNEGVELSVPVKNTGKKEGTEVVQVYLKKLNDTVGPIKTLRGFNRVALKPGETQLVKLALPSATFETYDAENGRMAVQPGKYELFYGSSSDNKDLQSIEVTVQ